MKKFLQQKGFTIFFATLVASLALAIGIAIYDITVRQLDLATTVTQSQYAIYAADSGTECALYWDVNYGGGGGSAFATSSSGASASSGVVCGAYDIAAAGTPPTPFQAQPTGWTPWVTTKAATAATTTFTLTFPPYSYCARVEVAKATKSDGTIATTIYSHGFNICAKNAQSQLERELKVSY
jgi:hypothetical protein